MLFDVFTFLEKNALIFRHRKKYISALKKSLRFFTGETKWDKTSTDSEGTNCSFT